MLVHIAFLVSPYILNLPKLPALGSTFIQAERQGDILEDVSRHCKLPIIFMSLASDTVFASVHVGGSPPQKAVAQTIVFLER